jgi:hypothetical protein
MAFSGESLPPDLIRGGSGSRKENASNKKLELGSD